VRSLWGSDPASQAVYFDSFTVLNTAFSGLAFAGVIFAILLQRQELHLQRQELEATRAELQRSAAAQEQSQEALKQQVTALNETVRISQESLEPQVIVYAAADESRPTFIQMTIENIGRGAARNVRFEFPPELPHRAWGIESPQPEESGLMDRGPLVTGVPFLPPGGTRKLAWGQYGGLHAALGDKPVRIVSRFENQKGVAQDPIESMVDVKSFEFTDCVDPDGARQAAAQLENIAKGLHRVLSGFQRPVFVVQSKTSYERERQRSRERPAERVDQSIGRAANETEKATNAL
jgi:hypothetical protein